MITASSRTPFSNDIAIPCAQSFDDSSVVIFMVGAIDEIGQFSNAIGSFRYETKGRCTVYTNDPHMAKRTLRSAFTCSEKNCARAVL